MSEEITEEIKKEIFKLISTPGIDIEDISEKISQDYKIDMSCEKVMNILSDEYLRYNLDYGRRLCCRF